jgi:hypothetical protein
MLSFNLLKLWLVAADLKQIYHVTLSTQQSFSTYNILNQLKPSDDRTNLI